MKIATFWSDPHLGLVRTSHTTPQSRAKLREALFRQARSIQESSSPNMCLGDLFDVADNDEATIAQGAAVAVDAVAVLAGNHDSLNRDGRLSSLELLSTVLPEPYRDIVAGEGNDLYWVFDKGNASIVMVPHKRTQELFGQTLQKVYEEVDQALDNDRIRVLCLHANYNSCFATDDATLNLPREDAELLLTVFDRILIGHEHVARSDFGGKVQVLGNIHPTSFADISDKYVWDLHDDGTLEPRKVWDADNHMAVSWEWLVNPHPDSNLDGLQFIDVTGTAPAARLPDIAKAIAGLWQSAPDALMVRNSVKSEELVVARPEASRALDIPAKITAELAGSELLPLWCGYLERLS